MTSAPAVLSSLPSTTRPSNCCCKSDKSFAMISITFNSSALSTGIDALSRTADFAHSTLRLRLAAIASM